MQRESIVELIRKCLALAKSPNENEAAAAMGKAQELLLKYNLDMAEIKPNEITQDNISESGMINEEVDFSDFESWQSTLLNVIAIRNFCHVINLGNKIVHILGSRANVRSVETMYNWVEPQIIRLILASGYKRDEKSSYAYGIVNTIGRKLDEAKAQYQVNNPMSRSLIVNVQKAVDVWYKDQYPHTTTRKVSVSNYSAYGAGQSDGHRVSVNGSSHQVSNRLMLA
jgi:hypothetical protein